MMKMINGFTGTEMWVADDRVNEYKAAGHRLAAESEKPTVKDEPKAEAEEIKEPEVEETQDEEPEVKETKVKETKKATKTTKASTKKK